MVHPALLHHPNPKNVFIGGGGEGGTARECLRHSSVERCVMVDIDQEVVDFCKEHMPQNTAAFADPRLELIIEDAKKWLEDSDEKFDVILMDLDDPLEGGPCYQLYTKEFYAMCRSKLTENGVLVTQSGCAGSKLHRQVYTPINRTLREVFGQDGVRPYKQAIYSFMDEWGWNLAFNNPAVALGVMGNFHVKDADGAPDVDAALEKRLIGGANGGDGGGLQFMDQGSWAGLWPMSKIHKKSLAAETTVLSEAENTWSFMHATGDASTRGVQ
jgi:thermospermine synthase